MVRRLQQIAHSKEVDAIVLRPPPTIIRSIWRRWSRRVRTFYLEKTAGGDVPDPTSNGKWEASARQTSMGCWDFRSQTPSFVRWFGGLTAGGWATLCAARSAYSLGLHRGGRLAERSTVEKRLPAETEVYERASATPKWGRQTYTVIDICKMNLKAAPREGSATGGRAGRPARMGTNMEITPSCFLIRTMWT